MKLIVSTFAVALLGGCSMIPEYQTPESPVPQVVGSGNARSDQLTLPDWESLFQDPQLRSLIRTALTNNRDLRLVMLDVAEARARYGIAESALFPDISASADGIRQRLPANLSSTGDSTVSSQYSVGLGVASYELDLFGRVGSLEEAALQSYLATEEARYSAQITLVSEVANAYLNLLADQQKLRINEETVTGQQEFAQLISQRYDAGLSSELEVHQAQIVLDTARVNRAQFRRRVAEDRNALRILVSGAIPTLPEGDLVDSAVVLLPEVPDGLHSSVLLQRPDIRQAEYALRAANANIGAARAAFYPSINLTGSAGTASADLSGLFGSGSGTWSFMPSVNLPIFTAGRLQANLNVAEIRKEQSVIRYEQAIELAFQDVADALSAREFLSEQEQAQTDLVTALQRTLELAEARYENGADDYLAVLDARRELLAARQNLVDVTYGKLINRITLYRALGGGSSDETRVALNRGT
ncbi:efflux transporter outer membrane subunit [Allohahella marinimesophila]|uniref:Multidrug efflux RND transporter outer membrane channel subunit OprM n=1 Tax=Allohahella marinimesophila TaxID=1054972 RepID=A0ABP7P9J5_9GAMM